MSVITIYLDMDGVCCNFIEATAVLFGRTYDELILSWPDGMYSLSERLEITEEELHAKIDEHGNGFWTGLAEYSYFKPMYEYLRMFGEVIFLSTPTWNPASLDGKLTWLQDRYGRNFRDYIFTTHKHRLANMTTILIDDHPENCKKFAEAGGMAIQFPAPGFPLRKVGETTTQYIERKLKDAISIIERRIVAPRTYKKGLWL